MTTTARAAARALVAGAALIGLHAQTPSSPQTFRTGAEAVIVDVSVRERGRPVTGLRAEDFVLTDNGVRQRIESVEATAVPIDVTLVVDVSGSFRVWTPRMARPKLVEQVQAELTAVSGMLRPDDRVRLLAIDRYVEQVFPMQPVSSLRPVGQIQTGGMAAVFETLAAAPLQPVGPSRRHVVVARTKGLDTISSVDARAVAAIAERSDALFHVVIMETALDTDAAFSFVQCQMMDVCWPTARFWTPFARPLVGAAPRHVLTPDGQALATAAESTGGAVHQASGLTEPTLTGTLRKAFEDFRSSYVLRYMPQGVPQRGWHPIDVEVPASKGATVLARKGYLVEEPSAPPAPMPVPDVPRTIADFTRAYERQAYRQVVAGLRDAKDPLRLLRDFNDGGNPWPASPRREAALALELAEAAAFSSDAGTRKEAYQLLDRFSRLVRHPIEPDMFDRYWNFAALTLLEGSIRPAATEAFVARALERFPDEPRFLLSRAIATDQRWASRGEGSANASRAPSAEHVAAVRRAYAAAIAANETAAEAHIRLGWFLHRVGQHGDALTHLTDAAAKPMVEPSVRYLRELFLGHVLWALDRRDDAVAAYRAALAIAPAAQSARVALMNALVMRGDRAAADALAEQIQTEVGTGVDPWWVYWQGQYRLHSAAIGRLREMAR